LINWRVYELQRGAVTADANGADIGVPAMLASLLLTLVMMAALWLPPILLGIKWARRKGVSPHWMWFGVHPLTGWIAFWIIRYKVAPRAACGTCGAFLPTGAQFCSNCRAAIAPAAASPGAGGPSFRWFTNAVSCLECQAWVKLNARYCPQCSAPAPRLVCPSCQSSDTLLEGQHKALILGIVALVMASGFINQVQRALERSPVFRYTKSIERALTIEMLIHIGAGVLFFLVAASLLYGSFGTVLKRIACGGCGRKTPLSSREPQLASAAAPEPPRLPA
jgi:hypothetical protein